MNLKARMSAQCFGLILAALAGWSSASADNVKVNSRMSYYTHEKQAEILVYVPEGNGTAIFEGNQYSLNQGVNLIPVALQSLNLGDNQRTVEVECQGERKEYPVKLIRLAPKSHEVKIDYASGGLTVEGLPFLPTGFYSSLRGDNYRFLNSEVTEGINLYSPYHNILPENQKDRMGYLDLCAKLGIQVNYNVCSLAAGRGGVGTKSNASLDDRLQLLREEVKRVKDHPALLSYYIADEPDGQGVSPEYLKRAYEVIHEIDPYHPVSVVIISSLPARRYEQTYDIVMADPYPIPQAAASEAPRMIREIYDQMKYEKAVWLVPQVFGGGEIWRREPNKREVRAMCYGSILSGARAIQGFHRMPDSGSPLLWNGFKEVAVELQQLTPYLYDPNPIQVKTNTSQVIAKAYRANGNLLLIAQNMDNEPCPLKLNVPMQPLHDVARQVFENRTTAIRGGWITDFLPPFGTAVYKIELEEHPSKVVPGNLCVNPSFEESAEAGEVTGGPGGTNGMGDGSTLFPDTRVAFDGETSIRLTNPHGEAEATRRLFPIDNESDRTYILSVWAKADRNSLERSREQGTPMAFRLALSTLGEKTFELTEEWKRYEVVCPPKEYIRKGHGGASSTITLLGEGTAWFDLAQITPEIHIGTQRTADRKGFIVSMNCYLENGEVHYTTDGSVPTLSSPVYKEPFEVRTLQTITARVFVGNKGYRPCSKVVAAHKALDAKVTYLSPYSQKYNAGGDKAMTDGVFAPMNAQSPYWHGYLKNNLDLVVDLGTVETIHRVELGFMQSLTAWVMPPKTLEVLVSEDGEKYRRAGIIRYGEARKGAGEYEYHRIPFVLKNLKKKARYVRIKAEHPQTLPSWHRVQGESWMFIDEVVIE